jgi:hypothetical protein
MVRSYAAADVYGSGEEAGMAHVDNRPAFGTYVYNKFQVKFFRLRRLMEFYFASADGARRSDSRKSNQNISI